MNDDIIVDMGDAAAFATAYSQQDPAADINGDGIVDFGDVSAWQTAFTALNGQICYNVQLRYDHRNRLRMWTEMSTSSARHGSYQYDALSRRLRKEADTDGDGAIDDTAHFIYAGQADWQLIEEWDGAGASATRTLDYTYGNYIDEMVHSRDLTGAPAVEWFHHQDDLFSIVATTDASGAVVERFQYGDDGDRGVLAPDGTPRAA